MEAGTGVKVDHSATSVLISNSRRPQKPIAIDGGDLLFGEAGRIQDNTNEGVLSVKLVTS